MLFNSWAFALFLIAVLLLYGRLGHRGQNRLLLIASYWFYGSWDGRFLTLIAVSTLVDFGAGQAIAQARRREDRFSMRRWLALSITTNLGILGFFKYWDFFVESAQVMLASVGLQTPLSVLGIILPVGISFYTFQTLSYTIDVYRGDLEPVAEPLDFALYVAFFPQLVAGPIERASRLLPQIRHPRLVTDQHWREGLTLILIGLVRKVVIADTAGAIADDVFARPNGHTSLQLACGLFAYGLQIYGDFAGYSNMARGSARLLGFELMRNFRHPYFAHSPSDFWRRWHISLSTWLRDYVYIPLGGNRRGEGRTHVNLMATMLLGGLWHGASWNFVFWGGLHGIYLAVHRVLRSRWALPERGPAGVVATGASVFLTCTLANATWLFFRASDWETTRSFVNGLLAGTGGGEAMALSVVVLVLLLLSLDLPQHRTDDEFCFLRLPPVPRGLAAGVAIVLLIMSGRTGAPFIYFQF